MLDIVVVGAIDIVVVGAIDVVSIGAIVGLATEGLLDSVVVGAVDVVSTGAILGLICVAFLLSSSTFMILSASIAPAIPGSFNVLFSSAMLSNPWHFLVNRKEPIAVNEFKIRILSVCDPPS